LTDDTISSLREGRVPGNIIIRRKRVNVNGDRHTAVAWYNAEHKVWRRADRPHETFSTVDDLLGYN
jgi:hypothetical protein